MYSVVQKNKTPRIKGLKKVLALGIICNAQRLGLLIWKVRMIEISEIKKMEQNSKHGKSVIQWWKIKLWNLTKCTPTWQLIEWRGAHLGVVVLICAPDHLTELLVALCRKQHFRCPAQSTLVDSTHVPTVTMLYVPVKANVLISAKSRQTLQISVDTAMSNIQNMSGWVFSKCASVGLSVCVCVWHQRLTILMSTFAVWEDRTPNNQPTCITGECASLYYWEDPVSKPHGD